ncbi:hypothetical protein EBS67_07980 [bacterium]|nr:hypothetical protein [bacterium]
MGLWVPTHPAGWGVGGSEKLINSATGGEGRGKPRKWRLGSRFPENSPENSPEKFPEKISKNKISRWYMLIREGINE